MKIKSYKTTDKIIGELNLQKRGGTEICIEITDTDVCLYVGPRDWQWDRKTGKLVGCGTCVD